MGVTCLACKYRIDQPFGLTECPNCTFPFDVTKVRAWVRAAETVLEYNWRALVVSEAANDNK